MKRVFQLTILGIALVAIGTGCPSGGDDDDDNVLTVPPAVKGSGANAGDPVNFTCNGGGNPFVGGVGDITMPLAVVEQPISGSPPPAAGVTVQQIDADTSADIGSPSTETAADGLTSLTLPGNMQVALKLTSTNTAHVPTYYFNYVTPPTAPGTPDGILVIPQNVRDLFLGFYGFNPSDLAGKGAAAGSVLDCDGDTVQNAIVEVPGSMLVGYFGGGTPDADAVATDDDGQFVVVGMDPTSSRVTATVKIYDGTEAMGEPTTAVAEVPAQYYADSITIEIALPIF